MLHTVGDPHPHAPTSPHTVGGNHEAVNYLWELYHGGWAAPNIYYLGYAGVIHFGGLRIAGMSGIFKEHHFNLVCCTCSAVYWFVIPALIIVLALLFAGPQYLHPCLHFTSAVFSHTTTHSHPLHSSSSSWQGHYERAPYNRSTLRSAYHLRALEVYRLLQIQQPVDVFLSHDWPLGIAQYGDQEGLLRRKKFLRKEVRMMVFLCVLLWCGWCVLL